MNDIDKAVKEVMHMKERVELTGKKKATAEGEQKILLVGLKKEHGIVGLKQLGIKIDALIEQLESFETDVIDGVKQLRSEYNFGDVCTD
jgi:hypothetical protein